jgi:hypothetical protein
MTISELFKKPVVAILTGVVIGLAAGLLWAWQLDPVQWTNVPPAQMGTTYQEQYLRMAVDSYRVQPDDALALARYQALGLKGPTVLAKIVSDPGSQDINAILNFSDVVQAGAALPTVQPGGGSTAQPTSPVGRYLLIAILVLVVGVVFYLILRRFVFPLLRSGTPGAPTAAMRAHEMTQQTELTDYEAMGEEPPIAQFVTTYVVGDDLFDDSFSIDSPSGEFMGECGIGISETIGVGEPKKVQAFEVWLFDKNDIQTVTKVLMSAHAFNDVATMQRLEAKGEPVLVERGKQVILETAALQLVANVSEMQYGQGALPEGSYFERLTLEIAVWPKVVAPA